MAMLKIGKKNPITKAEFHRRLREWFTTTNEKQIGPGKSRYICIYDNGEYYFIHSDARRFAVKQYLSLVDQFGDSIEWKKDWSIKNRYTLIKFCPAKIFVRSLLLYSEKEGGIDRFLQPEDGDDIVIEESDLSPREAIFQSVKRRRGQTKFRNSLRKRYRDTCVVTGCRIVDLLEAAHIRTMSGLDDNSLENGLLLRADIHTLFDLNFLWIEPDTLRVCLDASIAKSEYADYNGRALLDYNGKPLISSGSRPSHEALANRFQAFREGDPISDSARAW